VTPPAATAAGRAIPRTPGGGLPRRVSGPARPGTAARRHPADPLVIRALRRGRGLADSRFLDRLVRGRLWIPLVALSLMGIVFMQVSMLKLNAGISRAVQTATTLERQNAVFRADVSRLEAARNIDEVAHQLGMVVPADGSARYVTAGAPGAAISAITHMRAPSSTALARTGTSTQTTTTSATGATGTTGTTATTAGTTTSQTAAATQTTASTSAVAAQTPASTGTTATGPTTTQAAQTQQSTGATQATSSGTQSPVQQTTAPATTAPAGGVVAPSSGQGQP
jgi:hypothetical protein